MADDSGIQTFHIVPVLHHVFPPCLLDSPLQGHAYRAVVPEAIDAAIHFGTLENEAPALA